MPDEPKNPSDEAHECNEDCFDMSRAIHVPSKAAMREARELTNKVWLSSIPKDHLITLAKDIATLIDRYRAEVDEWKNAYDGRYEQWKVDARQIADLKAENGRLLKKLQGVREELNQADQDTNADVGTINGQQGRIRELEAELEAYKTDLKAEMGNTKALMAEVEQLRMVESRVDYWAMNKSKDWDKEIDDLKAEVGRLRNHIDFHKGCVSIRNREVADLRAALDEAVELIEIIAEYNQMPAGWFPKAEKFVAKIKAKTEGGGA